VIEGRRITAIGPAARVQVPAGARQIALPGKWLVPGLMNMHVHFGLILPGLQTAELMGESDAQLTLRTSEAAELGVHSIEHGYFLDRPTLKLMKQRNVWFVPTIIVSQPATFEFFKRIGAPDWYMARVREVGKDHWRALQMAIEEGVGIAMGSDQFPFEPNDDTIASVRETEYYAEAGMSSSRLCNPRRSRRPACSTCRTTLVRSAQASSPISWRSMAIRFRRSRRSARSAS
jgi:imidazolonepropionase-like amidohydrolase